jgi:hypothetical protein
MEKRELEVMCNYHYGTGKSLSVWIDEVDKLVSNNEIKRIYQIVDKEYNDCWFLVRDKKEMSYILKTKRGNEYSIDVMNKYRNKYNFYKISTDVIELFDKGYFPIVFLVKNNKFDEYFDKEKNINNAFFRNYICLNDKFYRAVREYRNKVEYEEFIKKEDAIQWCIDYKLNKDDIIKSSIKKTNLLNYVYDYEY